MSISHRTISTTEREQILKELRVYGYCVVEKLIDAETVNELKQQVDKFWGDGASYKGVPNRDTYDKIVYNLQNKAKIFIDLLNIDDLHTVLMPKLNDPYYRFLPPDVPNYYLHYYNARSSGERLELHIDSHVPFTGERAIVMQSAFLLDDHNEGNGCTIVVPGSHLSGEFTDRELKNVKPVIAQAGDVVLWDSRLWHGTLENTTKASRWSLVATWGMWWIKPAMDITRGLPEEIYCQLDERQKQLLGYCCIPPANEKDRINTKSGYDALLPLVRDYYKG
jgi:ectoine hydroxylase-related dioxygenase (phytanoyl-CoA dioxygenase family)